MYIATNTCMYFSIAPVPCMTILTHLATIIFWMDKTVFGCPTIQAAILHVHCMKNTKFNLISYKAKCTLELASKETPMSSRAFL